jgi:alpha-ketoglutarate-dependent 2,4-dichlorophenoxyacetate dioxygenase
MNQPMDSAVMPLSVKRLHPLFAAEINGPDLSRPLDAITARAIEQTMDEFAVAVIPAQQIDDAQQIAFAGQYGPLEVAPMVKGKTGARGIGKRIEHREIFDISNLDDDGRILDADDQRATYQQGNQLWHTDSSFRQKSATWSLLHARVIPPDGADTEFVDTRAVYDALTDAMKSRIEGLVAEHSIWHSRAKLGGYVPSEEERQSRPPAQHPLVRRHPGSGRKALYIASHASHIVGWPIDQGRTLLEELIDFATQAKFVYAHQWRVGDLVIWDNRCTLHRATPYQSTRYVRDLRRTTIIDVAQAAAV